MNLDLESIFALSVSPWEMVIRGSAMYWFLLVLFRVVVRRRVGAVATSDLLLLVIIADAAQNAMAGEYRSVSDGFILVATIVAWNTLVDWLIYRSELLARLLEPPPLLLIHQGRVLWRHLRMEFVTEQELRSKLREHGIGDYADVEKAYLEPDGSLGVIRRPAREASPP